MKRSVTLCLLATVLSMTSCDDDEAAGSPSSVATTEQGCARSTRADEVRAMLLASEPGVGVADYPGYPVADIPKATAAILLAEAICARASEAYDRATMNTVGERLLSWPDRFPGPRYGWGLPFAWDAFGDGTENEPATVYSISTGIAVKALLDWADLAPDEVDRRIEESVERALAEWLEPAASGPSGQLVYSLSAADAGYDVFNSSAMLAGQMQRFAARLPGTEGDPYRQTADRVVRSMLDQHQEDPKENWYWNYSTSESVANDMTHAGYIVDGLLTYAAFGGTFKSEIDAHAVVDHLLAFANDGSIDEDLLSWPIWRSPELTRPQDRLLRLYEEGWSLYTAGQHEERIGSLIEALCRMSLRHEDDDGRFHKYALDVDLGDTPNPEIYEYVAYYYLGLVTVGRGACGD